MRGTSRCQYSEEGKREFPRQANRVGVIKGEGYENTCWSVLWDGRKTSEAVHKSLISIIE